MDSQSQPVSAPVVQVEKKSEKPDVKLNTAANAVIKLRKSEDRGHAEHGWLNSYHTFSFASYFEPAFANFHSFRVLNEDRVEPSEGFPTHPHSEFEIFSYVQRGALRHNDSMGNTEVLGRGAVQFTSAGTGIRHSEFNASDKDYVHFLQMWVKPSKSGLKPSYQTRIFPDSSKRNQLRLIVAPDGVTDFKDAQAQEVPAVRIGQDVRVYASLLAPGERVALDVAPGRDAYVHLIQDTTGFDTEAKKTAIKINGQQLLKGGDGAFVFHTKKEDPIRLTIEGAATDGSSLAEFLVFDVAQQHKP